MINVENISKLYKLGDFNTGTLSHDINRWWHKISGKNDPYEQFAEENDRTQKSSKGYVWSLKDVNFSVRRGEVFGIVGKNGAGKSTLLKLLSKITKPTTGCIKIDGRVASLLEVGTGFHPDLSGRENVFLNGAILGMRKHEIKKRFDEIVEFSGIEKYIDTPVKRYSSGMFVRLAFAVAAHLEPEILIIDEVLAVGDAEFQQKCIGKMQDVANQKGRTILFVSHNNTAIKRLCTKVILLEKGMVKEIGTTEKVLETYQMVDNDAENGIRNKLPENTAGYFIDWKLEGHNLADSYSFYSRDKIAINTQFRAVKELTRCIFHILIWDTSGNNILHACSTDFGGTEFNIPVGEYKFRMEFSLPVKQGKYNLELGLFSAENLVDRWETTTKISVLNKFEQHSVQGLLTVKTNFNYQGIPSLVITSE